MAQAIAEGARSAGAQVDIRRVPETVPEATTKSAHFKLDQKAPVAALAELANYDAIIAGNLAKGVSQLAEPRWRTP